MYYLDGADIYHVPGYCHMAPDFVKIIHSDKNSSSSLVTKTLARRFN